MVDKTQLINALRSTERCLSEVEKTAALFNEVSKQEIEGLIRIFIDEGEDKALGILLNICAVKRIKLDPYLLADTLRVVHNPIDFIYPYRDQCKETITPLLDVAQAEDISVERQVLALRLVTEFALIHNDKQKIIKKLLLKLSKKRWLSDSCRLLLNETQYLYDRDEYDDKFKRMTQLDIIKELPREKPHVVTGGFFTVRRSVPKVGRNDPCPCGSGKKYKKCCYEKDQELLRDASPYEGITMTQAQSSPGLVEGVDVISEMRAYQLKKLKPVDLNNDQLLEAYKCLDTYGLREQAFEMLLELKGRSGMDQIAVNHMHDLLWSVLEAGDLELIKKIEKCLLPDQYDRKKTEFIIDLIENRDRYSLLEKRCHEALTGDEEAWKWGNPLVDLSYDFEKNFPALSIIFSRAAIVDKPNNFFDNDMLLEVIHNGRLDLDIDPWDDPIEEFMDWADEKNDTEHQIKEKEKEINELRRKLSESDHRMSDKDRELREKMIELETIVSQINREKKEKIISPVAVANSGQTSSVQSMEQRNAVNRLKQHISNLKMEISAQQDERRRLRDQLRDMRKKTEIQKPLLVTDDPDAGQKPEFERTPKKIPVPEYSDEFKASCNNMPPAIVSKALHAIAEFASQSPSIHHQVKSIEGLTDVYRVRIGLHHRLMIKWEKGPRLKALDLINRESLDTWIKRYAG